MKPTVFPSTCNNRLLSHPSAPPTTRSPGTTVGFIRSAASPLHSFETHPTSGIFLPRKLLGRLKCHSECRRCRLESYAEQPYRNHDGNSFACGESVELADSQDQQDDVPQLEDVRVIQQ